MGFWPSEKLLETQTTDYIDHLFLTVLVKHAIDGPCMLPPDLTWSMSVKD